MTKFFKNKFTKTTIFGLLFISVFALSGANIALATTTSISTDCVVVDTLGDNSSQTIGSSSELSVANIVSNAGLSISSQKEHQVWKTQKSETQIKITFLDGYSAAGDVFGYYEKGDLNTFVPLFKNGNGTNSTYSVSQATPGQTYTINLPQGDYGFAIHTELEGNSAFRASENSLNGGDDHMIAYNVHTSANPNYGKYVLGFEDLAFNVSDKDYNDIVVKVEIKSCEAVCVENANLTITQNLPSEVTPGQTYTFKINAHNNGDTKWYHGSYFKLVSTSGNLSINPTYGHLPGYIYPGDNVEWSFDITATTTPGDYSVTLQMVHKSGAEYRDASFVECAPAPSTDVYFGNNITVSTKVVAVNTPPTLTLVGSSPVDVYLGDTYTDAGATANDLEDGNITSNIVVTGSVDTNTLGTYTLTYNVTDSGGLSATPVERIVKVIPVPVIKPLTIVATKIVCDSEADLPNWGLGGPDISSTTAKNFVDNNPNCRLASGWDFQWSFEGETGKNAAPVLSGDFVGPATTTSQYSSWNTFGSTDLNGVATTTISNFNGANKIWVREVLKSDYISFGYPGNNDSVSAEMYCHKDVLNYDNYDFISPISLEKTYYCVAWNVLKTVTPVNTPPTLTLVGSSPVDVYLGDTYTDAGATANDLEDGNITSNIVVTGSVDTNTLGTYTLTYNVTDSGGLSATPVSRTVNVLKKTEPVVKGKITFCLVLGDQNNNLATSSYALPSGSFAIDLATSTAFGGTVINSKTWNTNTFNPNANIILSENDADCVTYENLEFGEYFYSEAGVSGALWNTPKYSDQYNQPVNNVFDLHLYSPELFNATTTDDSLRNMNSDGSIVLTQDRKERVLVIYSKYDPIPACVLPSITSTLTASAVVGNLFTYAITASSTPATTTISIATSTLPAWLSFATSTNTLSGTATTTGTFDVTMYAENNCGTDTQTLVITVTNPPVTTVEANLDVVKTSDKTTVNVGDEITYTIKIVNNGPDTATNVKVTDTISSDLEFISATSTLGAYSTTTSEWIIGNLSNTASTTLTIVVKVKSGTEGKTIANTAVGTSTVNDPNSSNNTSTVNVSVNNPTPVCTSNCTPPPPPACSANCGGGGGGPITPNNLTIFNESVVEITPGVATVTWNTNLNATRRVVFGEVSNAVPGSAPNYGYASSTILVESPVLTLHSMNINIDPGKVYYFRPISTDIYNGVVRTVIGKELVITRGTTPTTPTSCYYLLDYLRKDFNNNPVEVRKLQVFLRDLEGFTNIQVTGVYDDQTINYLNQFQNRYAGDILTPWGHTAPTSYTYILTKKKVNEIYCKMAFPVTPLQQQEIDNYRAFLLGLQNSGISVPTGGFTQPNDGNTNTIIPDGQVGTTVGGSNQNNNQTTTNNETLAGVSTTTRDITENLFANVISSGKKMGQLLGGFFTWPIFNKPTQCLIGYGVFGWINLILILVIIVISYLWYREVKNRKTLEEINKEIDLENK